MADEPDGTPIFVHNAEDCYAFAKKAQKKYGGQMMEMSRRGPYGTIGYERYEGAHAFVVSSQKKFYDRHYQEVVRFTEWLRTYMEDNIFTTVQEMLQYVRFRTLNPRR